MPPPTTRKLPVVTVSPFEDDPTALAVVRPEDKRWQLVIDKDSCPHLYVQVNVEDDDGKPVTGMLCLDEFLPDDMSMHDLMTAGSFVNSPPPPPEKTPTK